MSRRRLVALGALCTTALCAWTAPAGAEPSSALAPHTITVGRTQTVAPHDSGTTNVPCQGGQVPSGGGVRTSGNGVFLTATWPSGISWAGDVYNETDTPQTFTPIAICTSQRHTTRHGTMQFVEPGHTEIVRAVCDPGQVATGGGPDAGDRNTGSDGGQSYISQSSDIGQEWVGRVTNHGPRSAILQTWVRCADAPHSARASGPTRLARGATGTAHAECPPGEVPTGGGGLGNPAVDFNESFPTATGWTMRATNHGSIPLDLFARVTCTRP
ncbi:hypothetical protein OIE66_15165 [Nonomuraea sp. NBC_01738]|uniref:hypothetical protein n=1 Tax=Nonomuraea sp. NBC_01738 TaxID=2976003 RepID=UPI002E14F1E3|nr:hypothetical protein OIE66_15165 [Nonomuraea sp. NBC_01738]